MNRDDRRALLVGVVLALCIACAGAALADEPRPRDAPSPGLCRAARAAVAVAGSERAAEDAARSMGVSEATIQQARRCKR